MRVSEYYTLDRTQPELDFVDVDVRDDVRLFLEPQALKVLGSQWGDECVYLLQHFFETLIQRIIGGRSGEARPLLAALKEPDETHLGLSKGESHGRGLGQIAAGEVWEALTKSGAVQTGLLQDLEDTVLMISGIGPDIISDMTTNIIREPLISYTQETCKYYEIPLEAGVASGPIWDVERDTWTQEFVELPVAAASKLLLVPKSIVRWRPEYDPNEYYNLYLLEHLRQVELSANSGLVEVLKSGRRVVTDKNLRKKYGTGKSTIIRETAKAPELLEDYRRAKQQNPALPLNHMQLADTTGSEKPSWDRRLQEVKAIDPGPDGADSYLRSVEALLSELFYPALVNPRREFKVHEGRKRIDIAYTNVAAEGFFHWLALHYPAAHVYVECKNYTRPVGNPEFDQLAGRFSPSRGRFGFLVYRGFADKEKCWRACRDTAHDDRGWMIPLDDDDLEVLVRERESAEWVVPFGFLKEAFNRLIS